MANVEKIKPRKKYHNLNEYQRERSNISYKLSENDEKLIENKKRLEQEKENERRQRQRYYDEKNEESYRQFNRLFLT